MSKTEVTVEGARVESMPLVTVCNVINGIAQFCTSMRVFAPRCVFSVIAITLRERREYTWENPSTRGFRQIRILREPDEAGRFATVFGCGADDERLSSELDDYIQREIQLYG